MAKQIKNLELTSDDQLRFALERQPGNPVDLVQSVIGITDETVYELCLEAGVTSQLDNWMAAAGWSANGGFDGDELLRNTFLSATRAFRSLRAKALHASVALAAEQQQQAATFAAEEAIRKPGEAKSVVRTRTILAQEAAVHARSTCNELRIAAQTADRVVAGEVPIADQDLRRRIAQAESRAQSRR